MEEYNIHYFDNGIRLIHKQVGHTKIAHCGIVLDIGSRDEKIGEEGIAHFWEHMAFKGTTRRKAFHILNRIDSVGGELNAHTTKEKIFFYASTLVAHYEKAAELLCDITFNATFPEKEIVKERGVIMEEMAMYADDPGDAISDEFDHVIFGEHPLGQNILGNKQSVARFGRADFQRFIKENMDTSRLIFTSVGPLPMSAVIAKVGKHLEKIPFMRSVKNSEPFLIYTPEHIEKEQPITQAHCAIGGLAPSNYHPERLPFMLLINILGGPAMNSRLNLAIREKYGFVYDIGAQPQFYLDTGMFAVQFATENNRLERCKGLVVKELERMRNHTLGTKQLHSAKQQLKGQLAMSEESNLNLMLYLGKRTLEEQPIEDLAAIFEMIDQVDAGQLQYLAQKYFEPTSLSSLIYRPEA